HDRGHFDEVRDKPVVEAGRNRVAARRRRTLRQGAVVDGAVRVHVEEPAALTTEGASQLLAAIPAASGRLLLPAALHLASAGSAALTGAALAVETLERLVGLLGPLLRVQRALDALVELVELLIHHVPLTLLLGREIPVVLGGAVGDRLHLLPDLGATLP